VAAFAAALSGTTSPMTVRDARNSLSEVLRRARSGDLSLIGRGKPPGDLALVISVAVFAEILQKARKPQTLPPGMPSLRSWDPRRGDGERAEPFSETHIIEILKEHQTANRMQS
jgi:hypothetical protein